MAQINVSNCILSIIGSFTSGSDVFKKFRESRQRHKDDGQKKPFRRRNPTSTSLRLAEQELRLAHSLRQGPEDIGREYQKNLQSSGDHFALGDAIAHISLADIQLRLNSGLVKIIHSFLARNSRQDADPLNYESLLDLSEKSRIDTCRVLRDLHRRIVQLSSLFPGRAIESAKHDKSSSTLTKANVKPNNAKSKQHRKIRGPTLAKVYISNSSKPGQIAVVKPSKRAHGNKSSSAPLSAKPVPARTNDRSSQELKTSSQSTPRLPHSPPPAYENNGVANAAYVRPALYAQSQLNLPQGRFVAPNPPVPTLPSPSQPMAVPNASPTPFSNPNPSALYSSPQLTTWLHSTTDLDFSLPAPPLQTPRVTPKQHVISNPHLPPPIPRRTAARQPIPTYYSAQTASTKLGEIPLHRWAEAWDFEAAEQKNRAAMRSGWPVRGELVEAMNGAMDGKERKKGGGLFGFWRGRRT